MKKLFLSAIVCLGMFGNQGTAQVLTPWDKAVENFHYRLKNIEFFIDRFNNQPEGSGRVAGLPEDSTGLVQFVRERDRKLLSLFDLARVHRHDTAWLRMANGFILSVNSHTNPLFLRFNDPDWFASAKFVGKEHDKECGFRAQLEVRTERSGETYWQLAQVSMSSGVDEDLRGYALQFAPNSNGTNFVQVVQRLMDSEWLAAHRRPESGFLTSMMSGKCTLEGAVDITYHFFQIPGWYMRVSYVDRASTNAGWLIHSIQPMSDQEKLTSRKALWKQR